MTRNNSQFSTANRTNMFEIKIGTELKNGFVRKLAGIVPYFLRYYGKSAQPSQILKHEQLKRLPSSCLLGV
ncbi:hypothetical protein T4D_8169 [Trichinella pseudospiralis]|uniref:Uncharacterized protein n=1 Tax=Trichinella pseudospiralis TaxID=6337 RepID=A0A0V1FWF6_TRIPS|nr:hypothetical protein T4D_8169 [Trichinella pseudospiralis]